MAIYPELDRIRRALDNEWVLIRICPYPDIHQAMIELQRALADQLAADGEAIKLQLRARNRYIYARKVVP